MTQYPTLLDVLTLAQLALDDRPVQVRDIGLLQSVVGRPQVSVAGQQAYPTLARKAAALLHSLAANHALLDGNKRTAVVTTLTFLELNGVDTGRPPAGDVIDLAVRIAGGLDDLDAIEDGLCTLLRLPDDLPATRPD